MTYDAAIFVPGPSLDVPSKQQLWDEDDPGLVVTGIVKLAQRFLLTLLTPRGSLPFARTSGTTLFSRIDRGIVSEAQAYLAMQFAIVEAEAQILAEESEDDPLDERFLQVEVTGVTFVSRGIRYQLKLTSLAGTSRQVTLPLRSI